MTDKAAGEKSPPTLNSLASSIGAVATRGPAPVERWNPPYCGEIDMKIAADGQWFYEGSPIKRQALTLLFASILRKDPERYVLVTPAERIGIVVEDVPFVAVALSEARGVLRFASNLGDEVEVGHEHGLRFAVAPGGGIKPYVHIRGGLWARLTRSLAIELLDRTVRELCGATETVGIRSSGLFFPIGSAELFS